MEAQLQAIFHHGLPAPGQEEHVAHVYGEILRSLKLYAESRAEILAVATAVIHGVPHTATVTQLMMDFVRIFPQLTIPQSTHTASMAGALLMTLERLDAVAQEAAAIVLQADVFTANPTPSLGNDGASEIAPEAPVVPTLIEMIELDRLCSLISDIMDVLEPLLDHIVTRSSQAKDATNNMREVSFLLRGIAMAVKQKHQANVQGDSVALNAAEVQLEALHAKLNATIGLLPVRENVDI